MSNPSLIKFTKHAAEMCELRNIESEWIERTLNEPEATGKDGKDTKLQLAFRRIPEFDGKWLRVVYRREERLVTVITAFFDRGMERRT